MKKIERKFSIIWMSLFATLFVGLLIFTFVPMKWGSYNYNSFLKAINLSDEFSGRITATYAVTNDPTEAEINSSIKKITRIVEDEGYSSVSVNYLSDKKVSVSIATPAVGDDYSESRSFLSSLAGGEIVFSTASNYENINDEGELTLKGSKNFKDLKVVTYSGSVGVQISYKFSKEDKATGLDQAVYKTLYMYRNGEAFPSSSGNTINQNNSQNSSKTTLWFRNTDTTSAYDSAVYYKKVLEAGSIALNLDEDSIVFSDATPVYSSSFLTALYVSLIILLVAFVAVFIYLIIRWRALGIVSCISFIFVVMLSILVYAILPWISFGMSSFVAVVVSACIIILNDIFFINKISSEHKLGKSISTSIDSAYSKLLPYSIATSVVMFATGIAIALIGQTALVSAGIIIATSGALNALSSLVLNKLFIAFYQSFNDVNPKLYGLSGEDK